MFILVLARSAVYENARLDKLILGGPDRVIVDNDWKLFWREDKTARLHRSSNGLCFELIDPRSGTEQVFVRWDGYARLMTVARPFPGRVSIYASKDRQIYSSHLRLFAQIGHEIGPAPILLTPGVAQTVRCSTSVMEVYEVRETVSARKPHTSMHRSALELRKAVGQAVGSLPPDSVLLLSGGIDSSALAAAVPFNIRSVTWITPRARNLRAEDNELLFAARVAQHLKLPHAVLNLSPEKLLANVETAVLLGEVKRGTLIDDLVVYVEVARALRKEGVRTVVIGEAADDALGCLPFNLRILHGQRLLRKLQLDYRVGATADYAAISKTFQAFGIEAIDPFLSAPVADVVARIPLDQRVDQKRLMKPVLRHAFREELPDIVVRRHKRVSRDVSGVKLLMAERYGSSRDRFLPQFHSIFRASEAVERQRTLLNHLD